MVYLFGCGLLILFTIPWMCLTRQRFECVFPLTVFTVIVLLYLFALFGQLLIGFYTVLVLGTVAGLSCLVVLLRARETAFLPLLFTPGLLAFGVMAVAILWGTRGLMLSNWDEFSHWGLVIKNMAALDALGNAPGSTVAYQGYPPATALFQYFFVKLQPQYGEPILFRAMDILLITLYLPVFRRFQWKDWKIYPLIILGLFYMPIAFYPQMYRLLYVDGCLALLFAYLLYAYFGRDAKTPAWIVSTQVGLSAAILALTKASGAGLAAIGLLIIAADILLTRRRAWRSTLKPKELLCGLLPPCLLLLAKTSWDVYLRITHTRGAWNTAPLTLQNVAGLFTDAWPPYRQTTLDRFLHRFFVMEEGIPPYMWCIALFAAVGVLLAISHRDKGKRRSTLLITGGLVIGCAVYAVSLLLLYLFTYSQSEAMRIASCDRYMYTYLLGALVLVMYLLIGRSKGIPGIVTAAVICAAVLVTGIVTGSLADFTIRAPQIAAKTWAMRAPYTATEAIGGALTPGIDKVYVISQRSTGLDKLVIHYNATPVETSLDDWSLGESYYEGDIWTKDRTATQWRDQLVKGGYTYVYLFKVDEPFRERYSQLFEDPAAIENRTLFRLEMGESGPCLVRTAMPIVSK